MNYPEFEKFNIIGNDKTKELDAAFIELVKQFQIVNAKLSAKESMERELYNGLVGMYKIALKITAYSMTQSELEAKSNAKQLIKKYEDSQKESKNSSI